MLSEKLLENAKAAIDEVRQQADEINKLNQRVRQLEEEVQHLKAENTNLTDDLTKETGRATSLQHEVDRLRQKLVGPKTDEENATPHAQERMAKLEAEVYKLRRSLESLWNIESQRDKPAADEEDRPGKRWIWRAIAWLCAIALGGWLTATYLGLLP